MAVTLEQAQRVGYTLLKGLLRFGFMVANNLVAIPSYILYLIILQPLRLLDSKRFWYIEGVLFKWLLAMVASWGWWAGYTVVEWGDDVKVVSEDEAMMLVNHQATGDVCTLMMCLQDKGTVVRQMMWLMDHIFKYTNFGIVSLIHGDFFIRQGKAHRDQQLVLLKEHLDKHYRSRDRKWIVLFPEGGFLRKRRETSQAFAKKNNLPFLTYVTLPRLGATQVILKSLVAQQENGTPAGGDAMVAGFFQLKMYLQSLKPSLIGYINGSLKKRISCHIFTKQQISGIRTRESQSKHQTPHTPSKHEGIL
ncbi:acyl-CoA:lysophosphatidylglycerol acyltransferase 1 isoform X4 [Chrysemys picta bellii]|uniref:acyl-CoA:lysophosphatidylglycerol acyltransferase 1 isoform X4 n=1 Tax=Chrysemys picta bellii TaxID=8478 RepID=UPI001C685D40|nr:acyl-CoA:lysophosphatidylglycerol acyltransferase 1 isoform X4 [Chrysemys picta bellii]